MHVPPVVVSVSRAVRLATVSFLALTLLVLVALGSFDAARPRVQVLTVDRSCGQSCPDAMSDAATALVREAVAAGRTCSSTPVLTDHIVVEHRDGSAEVVTFDRALELSAAATVWVRRYCVPA
ncbi:MAG: hypothetical protein PGN07_05110 [Aeromicrobium erythreum]